LANTRIFPSGRLTKFQIWFFLIESTSPLIASLHPGSAIASLYMIDLASISISIVQKSLNRVFRLLVSDRIPLQVLL
jgi:hypothetical protein